MRTELIAAFNVWIKVPPEELAIITKVIKMLHTASLLYVSSTHCSVRVLCPHFPPRRGGSLSLLPPPPPPPPRASIRQSVIWTDRPFLCVLQLCHCFARVDDIEDDSVLRRGEPGNAFFVLKLMTFGF